MAYFFARGSVLKLIVRQLFQLPVCRGVSKIDEFVMCMVSINCSHRLIVVTVRMLLLIALWLYEKVITYFVSLFLFLCLSLILQSLLSFRRPAYTVYSDITCSGTHRCCQYTQVKVVARTKKILKVCCVLMGQSFSLIRSTAGGCLCRRGWIIRKWRNNFTSLCLTYIGGYSTHFSCSFVFKLDIAKEREVCWAISVYFGSFWGPRFIWT